jgi:CRP-like cAMP-binding protein
MPETTLSAEAPVAGAPLPPTCCQCVRASACLLAALAAQAPALTIRERTLGPGVCLQQQGEAVACWRAVKLGLVLLRRQLPDTPRAIAVVGPGQTLGVRSALLPAPAALDALALTPVRVCEAAPPDAAALAPLAPAILRELLHRTETLADWAAIARLPQAPQRVQAVLQRLATLSGSARVELPPRALLAELSACAPETVSRAVTALVRCGLWRRGERRGVLLRGPAVAAGFVT